VPLPAAATGASGRGLMVDGMRPMDGYAIEAKHVREPDCKKTFRDPDQVDKTLGTPPKIDENGKVKFDPHRDGMYVKDGNEMAQYRAALSDPRSDEIRGFEIITNDRPIRSLLAEHDAHERRNRAPHATCRRSTETR
jgi:hypothetical protein